MTRTEQEDPRGDEPVEDTEDGSSENGPDSNPSDAFSDVGSQRKARVLHTRVPAVLEQELKRLAESLRMPVSNVVRAILEDAVTAVDLVGRKAQGEMSRVVDRMAEKRERLRDMATGQRGKSSGSEAPAKDVAPEANSDESKSHGLEGVIGFQPLLLASITSCSICGIELKAGGEAFVGVRDLPGPRVLIGPECLPKLEED